MTSNIRDRKDGGQASQLLSYWDAAPTDFLSAQMLRDEVKSYTWRNVFLGYFRYMPVGVVRTKTAPAWCSRCGEVFGAAAVGTRQP